MNRVYERRRLGKHEFCLSKAKHTGVNRNFIPNCLRVRLSSKSFFRCFSLLFPLCVQKKFQRAQAGSRDSGLAQKNSMQQQQSLSSGIWMGEHHTKSQKFYWSVSWVHWKKKYVKYWLKNKKNVDDEKDSNSDEEWGGELVDGGWHIFFYFKFYVHDTIWGSSAILRERNLFHINWRRRTKRDDVIFSSIQKVETRWQFKGGCR